MPTSALLATREAQAYKDKDLALKSLVNIPDNFEPVFSENKATGQLSKDAWNASTKLAWALRTAGQTVQDSQDPSKKTVKDEKIVEEILDAVKDKPRMRFYVVYQLLSDSFENDADTGNILGAVSPELHKFAYDTMEEGLKTTHDPKELEMFHYIAARVAGFGASYLGKNEILKLFRVLKDRKDAGDQFLESAEATGPMTEIINSVNNIKPEVLQ